MKYSIIALIIFFTIIIAWQLWYVLLIGIKEPTYKIVEKRNGYQIRQYEPYITAQVTMPAPYKSAINKGFKILADYIFGDNKSYISMPMTAPVFTQEESTQKEYDISFVMPFNYNLETLPQPINKIIRIKKQKPKLVAVYTFTWYPSDKRIAQHKKEFIKILGRDYIQMRGPILLARYNPPFIVPF
ncbi:heme-binding protein [bacterium]|nr:heme-binding protein [bacterium]